MGLLRPIQGLGLVQTLAKRSLQLSIKDHLWVLGHLRGPRVQYPLEVCSDHEQRVRGVLLRARHANPLPHGTPQSSDPLLQRETASGLLLQEATPL